jgi:hypothetical protein
MNDIALIRQLCANPLLIDDEEAQSYVAPSTNPMTVQPEQRERFRTKTAREFAPVRQVDR